MNIAFPYRFDSRGRTAETPDLAHIEEMIEQLLFTAPGERVNRPSFGTGVGQLVFAPNSPELAAALQVMIQGALQRWLSDIVRIQSLVVTADNEQLQVQLVYTPLVTGQPIQVTLPKQR